MKRLFFVLVAVIAGIAGCTGTSNDLATTPALLRTAASAVRAPSGPTRTWILQGPKIEAQLFATNPTDANFIANKARQVFYPVQAASTPPPTWKFVIPWQKFNSIVDLEDAIHGRNGKSISKNAQVLAYDNEGGMLGNNPWTPLHEWQVCTGGVKSPDTGCSGEDDVVVAQSMKTFASEARQYKSSLRIAFMPAADLWENKPPNKYTAYLQSGVAETTAPDAEFYHIQAQGLELNTPLPYAQWVSAMYTQIHNGRASTIVTAGISTEANGTPVASQNIIDAVNATSTIVSGYWPNLVGNNEDHVLTDAISALATESPAP